MAVTMETVRAFIDPDEPDYAAAALALGPEASPLLAELARSHDPMLASKAVYLAGLVGGDTAGEVVAEAARHADPVVRLSAAATLQNVDDATAGDLALQLLDDEDVGVRKVAVQSAAALASADVRATVRAAVEADSDPYIRSLAPDLGG